MISSQLWLVEKFSRPLFVWCDASFDKHFSQCVQAAELGRWGVARTVLEHGLRCHPKHAIMAEKLVEVLLQLGDWQAAASAVERLLAQDPSHPRALHLRSASADPGVLPTQDLCMVQLQLCSLSWLRILLLLYSSMCSFHSWS